MTLKKLSLNDQILQNPQIFTEETFLNKKQLLKLMEKSEINDQQFEHYASNHKKQINAGIMGKTEKSIGIINCNFITNIGRLRSIYQGWCVGHTCFVLCVFLCSALRFFEVANTKTVSFGSFWTLIRISAIREQTSLVLQKKLDIGL